MQGLYRARLVAQGAFSLNLTRRARRLGGWPEAIGEDIVVTWPLMACGERVLFEPQPLPSRMPGAGAAFHGPTLTVGARDARGHRGSAALAPGQPAGLGFIAVDLLIPLLDVG